MEEEKTVTLRPVLALHGYAVDFSQKPGKMTYRFCSYDGAAGFWCLPPESGDDEKKVLHTGDDVEITFHSSIHDCEPDYIVVTNHHYGRPAVFSYSRVRETA